MASLFRLTFRRWLIVLAFFAIVGLAIIVRQRGPFRDRSLGRPQTQMTTESIERATSTQLASTTKTQSGWTRFRGPNGTGISDDSRIPIEWSDSKNLRWKASLPGPGSSSPIVSDNYVFITAYSGYGEESDTGDIQNLQRHVLAFDRKTGAKAWEKVYRSEEREDRYSGMGVPEHGYATNTGVTDGELVIFFLAKSGVVALDMEGNEKWKISVGTESGNREWGSAASLILYRDLVIVNAAEESQTLYALKKDSGEIVWKAPASSLELCYSTPAIIKVSAERDDLVVAVAGEIWGMNPNTGKLVWYAETPMTGNLSPSVIVIEDVAYAFGGYQSSGSIAVKAGGEGDVTKSHVLWTSRTSSYVATPVFCEGNFYWIDDRGMYFCLDAKSGEQKAKARGPDLGGGRPVYASPIAIGNKIYIQSRWGGLVVIEPKPNLSVISHNRFESDSSTFNATPAVDNGQLFLRSYETLYCIEDENRS